VPFASSASRTVRTRGHRVKQNLTEPSKNFRERVTVPRAMVKVSDARFDELVADALDAIPSELALEMENVAVLVEDWPRPEHLAQRSGTLLGLYEGIPKTERSPVHYAGVLPDRITIFRGPLCERARDEADLAEQVRVTVLHEVGHHFGMSDARLHELGWA
jgi:predicted Zn-dependent protease with MMP-like domain